MTQKLRASDPPYLKAAFSKLGLSEIAGPKHEKQVLEMYRACGYEISDDETAWCAAFTGWALSKGGLDNTGSLMARSYSRYGTAASLKRPIPRGAIIVWPRGKPPSGHVNFCLDDDGEYLTCIGGNQGNGKGGGVTISRERKSKAVAARMPVRPSMPVALAAVEPQHAQPEPDDTEPHAAPDDAPKTGITEGAKVTTGLGVTGIIYSVWETITQAPETILQFVVTSAQKPTFWLFAGVVGAAAYVWWRRFNMKRAA